MSTETTWDMTDMRAALVAKGHWSSGSGASYYIDPKCRNEHYVKACDILSNHGLTPEQRFEENDKAFPFIMRSFGEFDKANKIVSESAELVTKELGANQMYVQAQSDKDAAQADIENVRKRSATGVALNKLRQRENRNAQQPVTAQNGSYTDQELFATASTLCASWMRLASSDDIPKCCASKLKAAWVHAADVVDIIDHGLLLTEGQEGALLLSDDDESDD